MVNKRKKVVVSSDSETELRQTTTRQKRRRTSKSSKIEMEHFNYDKEDVDEDGEEVFNFDYEESKESIFNETDEMTILRQNTMQGLKRLLEHYMYSNGARIMSLSVKKFLGSFSSELETHFKSQRPIITEQFKQTRHDLISQKTKSLRKIAKFEETLQSEIEFMTDPALLLHIFCFLDLFCLVTVRTCCRYFKQCIQSNWTTIIPHLQLQWTCDAVKWNVSLDKIVFTIHEKQMYKQLCILAQEKYALSAIATAGMNLGVSAKHKVFDELFYNTAQKFFPFVSLQMNQQNIETVSKPKYGISTCKVNSKIVFFLSFKDNSKSFVIPKFTTAKKIVLFVSFAKDSTLTAIVEMVNSIQNNSNSIVEIYSFHSINKNEISNIALKKNLILFLFLSHNTLVLEENKRTLLPRIHSCKVRHFPSSMYIKTKLVDSNHLSSSSIQQFRNV